MSPQLPAFNRGIWKKLEELVRTWAVENNSLYIVTGPVLTTGLKTIGPDKVSVPNYYYKVILDYEEPEIKGIGFIMPNAGSSLPLQNFAITIDSVERFTGIDFYPALPDIQEKTIEKTLCIECWTWSSVKTGSKTNSGNQSSTSVQCSGTTKAGTRCKHMTYSPNGRCFQHGGD
jgi:endonuclease G